MRRLSSASNESTPPNEGVGPDYFLPVAGSRTGAGARRKIT